MTRESLPGNRERFALSLPRFVPTLGVRPGFSIPCDKIRDLI